MIKNDKKRLSLTRYLNIFKSKSILIQSICALVFLAMLIISIDRAINKGPGSDFHVFWLAGRNFLEGSKLYFLSDQARQFLYPPFAAFLFSTLALLPFKIAAVSYAIFNLFLWFGTFIISINIIENLSQYKVNTKSMILSFIFSFPFYLSNLNLLQVNNILFIFILLGLYFYIHNKFILSGLLIAAAVMFKVTPIIFLIWIIIRGNKETFLSALSFMALFILIPFLSRGIIMGWNDIQLFLQTLQGEVPQLKSLTEFVNNNSVRGMMLNYMKQLNFLNSGIKQKVVDIIPLLFGGSYILWLIYLKIRDFDLSEYEFAGTFLIILLTSAVTRDAHMVTLSFVFISLFTQIYSIDNKIYKRITISLGFIFILTGRDIIGDRLNEILLQQANLYTLILITLYILIIIFSTKKFRARQKPVSTS